MWTCEILSAPRSDLAKQKQSDQMSETKNLELEHRLLIVKLHSEGIDIPKIAELFNRSEYTVKNYISMHKKGGIEALIPSRQTGHISGFAICAKNDDYPVSLEIGKIYQIIFDAQDIKYNLIRIIDETGEDYLYPQEYFIPISLSLDATKKLAMIGQRESAPINTLFS